MQNALVKSSKQNSQPGNVSPLEVRTERELLAEQEGQLINALLGLAPAPKEIDSMQVEI